ncbi:MAG: hypothetical protein K0R54_715 [Clostridiaceae bacterium]|jgi:hypothetical protein|nr:hypothetical protein [Clostridiaceae bacterium]
MCGIIKEVTIKIDWTKYVSETIDTQNYLNNIVEFFNSNDVKEVIFFNIGTYSKLVSLITDLKSLAEKGNVYVEKDSVIYRPSLNPLSFKTWF